MVPTFEDFLYPFMLGIKEGHTNLKDLRAYLKHYMNLTDEDCEETTKGGNTTKFNDRIGWSRQYFHRAKFISIPKNGVYEITERGKKFMESHNSLSIEDLLQYPEYAAYAGGTKGKAKKKEPVTVVAKTPSEMIEDAYKQINDSLADDLLITISEHSPKFFETLVVKLLVAMGYGGDFEDAASVTQFSKDGGIDGVIKEDKLGLDSIYVQAKRWTNNVGKPDVQQFNGALDGVKASKGIFITTSNFSKDAYAYIKTINKRIVLIDGKKLADLMIEYNIGVDKRKTFVIKQIDKDFFDEDE